MKIKIFVALIATATIIFLSCNWFRSKKKEVTNPLIGEWKIDSTKAEKDTGFTYFSIRDMANDSNDVNVSFTKDSVFTHSKNAVDAMAYSFDEKANQMNIKDSSNQTFTFAKINDSLITLTSKDSLVLFLRRK